MTNDGTSGARPGLSTSEEHHRVLHAYAEGRTTFMGLELLVAAGALVPRAETEILGRRAISTIESMYAEQAHDHEMRIVDMCCGSGNLACAIASHAPRARVWASDLTDGCVSVARGNVEHLGLADRVAVHQGDLFAGFSGLGLEGTIDMVVCNPPYISTGKLEKERRVLLDHEPREAFDGGPYGLSIHQRVIKDALGFLKPRGWLMFEIGVGQEKQLDILFKRAAAYDAVHHESDPAGNVRVVVAQKKA